MLAVAPTTQTVVLMGGPCSGHMQAVDRDCTELTAVDRTGAAHVHVRTELTVDADDGGPAWVVFRRAAPEAAA
jgi:hypothetical protein